MDSRYVIVTPACNEEQYIGQTIESVLQQTVLPLTWVIVDDGSTDATARIVQEYAEQYPFIRYHYRIKNQDDAYYASNVFAIDEGYGLLQDTPYDFLAILDADIQLPAEYYQRILREFERDPDLGTASGVYRNLINGKLHKVLHDRRSTPKAIQVFRKEVYQQIGGYLPLPAGGEDTISCVMTRMIGKKAWSFPEIVATHLRPTGTGSAKGKLRVRFRQGCTEHQLGSHPVFFLLKSMRRMVLEPPFLLGGLARVAGYVSASCRKHDYTLPGNVRQQYRQEQLERVFRLNRVSG